MDKDTYCIALTNNQGCMYDSIAIHEPDWDELIRRALKFAGCRKGTLTINHFDDDEEGNEEVSLIYRRVKGRRFGWNEVDQNTGKLIMKTGEIK